MTVRHLRTWAEGQFAVMEERFTTVDARFDTVDEKIECSAQRVISMMPWRMLLADLAVVAAILGASAC